MSKTPSINLSYIIPVAIDVNVYTIKKYQSDLVVALSLASPIIFNINSAGYTNFGPIIVDILANYITARLKNVIGPERYDIIQNPINGAKRIY